MIRVHWLAIALWTAGWMVAASVVTVLYIGPCEPTISLHAICARDGVCYFATDSGQPVNVTVHDDGSTSLRPAPPIPQ